MKKTIICLMALSLAGCSFIKPYQPIKTQGSLIEQSLTEQLKEGMTMSEVNYLLGQPNFFDPLQNNAWVYAYTVTNEEKVTTPFWLTLSFNQNILKKIENKSQ